MPKTKHIIGRATNPEAAQLCCAYLNDKYPSAGCSHERASSEISGGLVVYYIVTTIDTDTFYQGIIGGCHGFLNGYELGREAHRGFWPNCGWLFL